jgi:hypothetical protein
MGKEIFLDAAIVASETYKVYLENDRVRVLEYRVQPGEKNAMHSHPDYLWFALIPEKFKLTLSDGKTIDSEAKAGEVFSLKQKITLMRTWGLLKLMVFLLNSNDLPPIIGL